VTTPFRASADSVDITPPEGFPLGGYILRSGVSEGVLDPILVRALLLRGGDDTLLLISVDWVYIDGRWARGLKDAAAKVLGVDEERVIVLATHTHSGPGVFGSSPVKAPGETAYLSDVRHRVVDTVRRLADETRQVTPRIGSTRVRELGRHRNDPKLPVDEELLVLTLGGSNGGLLGRVIMYGCHPTVLGPENLLFSGDWVGWGLSAVDRQLGGTSLFINGAAGDVSTRFTRAGRGLGEVKRYAEVFRDAVERSEGRVTTLSAEGITVRTSDVPVRYRDLPDREEAERALVQIEREIAAERERGASPEAIRRLESVREGAIVSLFFATGGGFEAILGERKMTATITLVRVGPLGMVFFPGEVMSETAIALKESARGPLAVCAYANDYFGYLSHGAGDYESTMALLSPDSIGAIVEAARALIGEDA
jgi:neutral ceramidase